MGFFFLWNTLKRRNFMNLERLLKSNEKICLYFSVEEKTELLKILRNLGPEVPENLTSPVIISREKISVITGFASGVLFSQPAEKLKKHGILKLRFSELSPEGAKSGWYESRNYYNNV